jgi:hypothetical protein
MVVKKVRHKLLLKLILIVVLSVSSLWSADRKEPTLVNLILEGGVDFRHLFVPLPTQDKEEYGYWYWYKRGSSIFSIGESFGEQQKYFEENYYEVTVDDTNFGVLKKASWLKEQIDKKRVALISNIYISKNRNRSHSLLKLESGNEDIGRDGVDSSGWGGRLAHSLGENIVYLTQHSRTFTALPKESNSTVISAFDTRDFGLYESQMESDGRYSVSSENNLARALKSYYNAKRGEIPTSSPFYKFIKHEQTWREYGEKVRNTLQNYPLPDDIAELYNSSIYRLNSIPFAKQIRSLYDTLLLKDVFDSRVISMEYRGWDSYLDQKNIVEPKFEDLFGEDRAFHRLEEELPEEQFTLLITSELGRQLSGNGTAGTDYGNGTMAILIGDNVNGGLYGRLFPEAEIESYQKQGSGIERRTSFELLIAEITDMMGGKAIEVVPNYQNRSVEDDLTLNKLFK